MSVYVVVNPFSANGRTRREWGAIEPLLRTSFPGMVVEFTSRRGHATSLVRAALQTGHTEIIAVGGDGTINEAVNGMFDTEGPLAPQATFGFITSGTGGDFRKTFGVASGFAGAIARLKEASVRAIDVGRLECLDLAGQPVVRHFVNIASFGQSGLIVEAVNRARIAKLFGGRFAFAFHSLLTMLFQRDHAVRIRALDNFDETVRISTVAIANGQYFGGGMRVAPGARPDDGLFDAIIMGSTSRLQMLKGLARLYEGRHVADASVRVLRSEKITATTIPDETSHPIFIEADGELAGQLPATFEILPRALNLRC